MTSFIELKAASDAARSAPTTAPSASEKLREVAQQFESLFTHMLLKNMRSASLGDGAMDSEQSRFYRDMFDQQLASELADGRGLGIADMLMRQLGEDQRPTPQRAQHAYAATAGIAPTASAQSVAPVAATKSSVDAVQFIKRIAPHAIRAASKLNIAPQFVLAQAALETGWGRRTIKTDNGTDSHNLFGVKAGGSWQGQRARATTHEFLGGISAPTEADFRAYPSEAASFDDYANLLRHSPRYRDALNQGDNGAAFARALQRGGYATDPNYASKLLSIAAGATMKKALASLKIL